MNALTIPNLTLFNHRKQSYHQSPDHQYNRFDQVYSTNYDNTTKNIYPSTKIDKDYHTTIVRGLSANSRYKQIAQNYVQKRNKAPSYFIDSSPYTYNTPSYLPKAPERQFKNCRGQCQNHYKQKIDIEKKNSYFGLDNSNKKQEKLIKDPYLQPTFRSGRGFVEYTKPQKEEKYIIKKQLKQQSFISNKVQDQVQNSKIMQKLKTNQSDQIQQNPKLKHVKNISMHQAEIQTQNRGKQSIVTQNIKIVKETSRPPIEKILQEQKFLIQSLKLQVQKQNDFKNQMQDLQSTKNDYIERSRQLLFKLNQLADDKREFSFILKSFTDKKKHNVFRQLDN